MRAARSSTASPAATSCDGLACAATSCDGSPAARTSPRRDASTARRRDELAALRGRLDGSPPRRTRRAGRALEASPAAEELAGSARWSTSPGRDELDELAAAHESRRSAPARDALAARGPTTWPRASTASRTATSSRRSRTATNSPPSPRASTPSAAATRSIACALGSTTCAARLAQAEGEALGARQAAAAAGEAAGAARETAGRAREEAAATRRELEVQSERASVLHGEVERLGENVATAREAATAARADAAEARAAGDGLAQRLSTVDERANALRSELGSGRERLDSLSTQMERLGTSVVEAGETAAAARIDGREQATALRHELSQVREVAESANRGIEALRSELAALCARTPAGQPPRRRARRGDAGRADLRDLQPRGAQAGPQLRRPGRGDRAPRGRAGPQGRAARRRRVDRARHRGLPADPRAGRRAQRGRAAHERRASRSPRPAEPVKRPPRHGFDDALLPLAILGLDGKFKELNPAFAKLVGYQEHQFAKAAWPSPHDRKRLQGAARAAAPARASANCASVDIQSTYMHGQGLMVPVVGKLTASVGEDGLPSHLMLEAEDRHTA